MEKCVSVSCECLVGKNKVEVNGKVFCSQECAEKCIDGTCVCNDCGCATA